MEPVIDCDTSLDQEIDNLSHDDLCEITRSSLRRIIASDKIFQDLPGDVTIDEVTSQIALAHGKSITITISRHYEAPINVVVPQQGTTVSDLKRAIERSFSLRQQRLKSKTKISWKYIWRTYNLVHWGINLDCDTDLLTKYDIHNKSEINFVKKLRKPKNPVLINIPHNAGVTANLWLEQVSRPEHFATVCNNNQFNENDFNPNHILVDHKHKLLYCYVPKVACTNWKRVFMLLSGAVQNVRLTDIPGITAHADNSTLRLSQLNQEDADHCLKTYTAFLMVRHPFERLLSAYSNKFENPRSNYFHLRYGHYIVHKYRNNSTESDKQGENVTFPEFIAYIINEGLFTNEHWQPIYSLCHPCYVNYTFVGHYESLAEDAESLLDFIGASHISFPVTKMANTSLKLKKYFHQLDLWQIQELYDLYKLDFQLFQYNVENLLGFDLS